MHISSRRPESSASEIKIETLTILVRRVLSKIGQTLYQTMGPDETQFGAVFGPLYDYPVRNYRRKRGSDLK